MDLSKRCPCCTDMKTVINFTHCNEICDMCHQWDTDKAIQLEIALKEVKVIKEEKKKRVKKDAISKD